MPMDTSGTFFSTSSTRSGEISFKKLSLMSSYQVEMKIPLSGYKIKLSDMLSMIIVRFKSRPRRLKSFTRKGPFCDVCCL